MKYRVSGIFEVDVEAESEKEALAKARHSDVRILHISVDKIQQGCVTLSRRLKADKFYS